MKKALLMVSFGTSYKEARRESIEPIRETLKQAFPHCEVREAYTSRIIAKKLNAQGMNILNEKEACEQLRADGYDDITAVVTHLIPGHEYDKVRASLPGVKVSEPLMMSADDLNRVAAQLGRIADAEGRTLLVMGHGTDHGANETYAALSAVLPDNVRLACVEGEPTLEALLPELEKLNEKKLALTALMLVAGDHARNDLGGDAEDSWKSVLEKRGFDVRVILRGLGSYDAIREMYVEKAKKAIG